MSNRQINRLDETGDKGRYVVVCNGGTLVDLASYFNAFIDKIEELEKKNGELCELLSLHWGEKVTGTKDVEFLRLEVKDLTCSHCNKKGSLAPIPEEPGFECTECKKVTIIK